jgi:isoleucyl-tRNA synthetase
LPTKFDFDGLVEVGRKYFDTLRNTYSFFALYANIDDVIGHAGKAGLSIEKYLEQQAGEPNRFDRWIISRYNSLVKEVSASLDGFEITRPVRAIQSFVIDDLSNWYVRNNRRRFWAKADDPSKMRAYLTLWRVLEGVCRLSAPIAPFTSELLWKQLVGPDAEKHRLPISVHMMAYPKADASQIDEPLEEGMDLAQRIVSLGRAARTRENLKVRQPLSKLLVATAGRKDSERLAPYLEIIEEELNIKAVEMVESLDSYVTYSAKLNFKLVGARLGSEVKRAAAFVQSLDSAGIREFVKAGKIAVDSSGPPLTLTTEDVEITATQKDGFAVESDGPLSVAIVTALTPELIDEGFAREMVNKIQNMRKTSGFDVTDRISVRVTSSDRLKSAARRYEEFIKTETLAQKLEFTDTPAPNGSTEWNINGEKASIAVARV